MIRVGILTVSDKGARGERLDESGGAIKMCLDELEVEIRKYEIVPDEKDIISSKLKEWVDGAEVDLLLTTGGTGLSPRDVTPEATLAVLERLASGFAEVMRAESLKVTPMGMLSRAVAGVRKSTLIINLPGSPKAVKECLQAILPAIPHAIEVLKGDVAECGTMAE